MQLLCPHCCSEERGTHTDTVAEAESHLSGPIPDDLFVLDVARARRELADPHGAISALHDDDDAGDLHRLLFAAQSEGMVRGRRGDARISILPLSLREPAPLTVLDTDRGPSLLGREHDLARQDGEDALDCTIRVLSEVVAEANALASRAADAGRLDRIAAFMNANRPWNGGDVCEFVAGEIVASGRRLLESEE